MEEKLTLSISGMKNSISALLAARYRSLWQEEAGNPVGREFAPARHALVSHFRRCRHE
jgi:hypothetical protein